MQLSNILSHQSARTLFLSVHSLNRSEISSELSNSKTFGLLAFMIADS